MDHQCIITIGREYGSGGRSIGRTLAERLNIPFYDKELLKLIAIKSGVTEKIIKQLERLKNENLIYSSYDVTHSIPIPEQIFQIGRSIIEGIASKGSCVMVGRCADFILKNKYNCLRVFIFAPFEDRLRRVTEEYKPNTKNIKKFIEQTDKDRATYYDYFTTDKWGEKNHYHIALNSNIGIGTCVDIIEAAYKSACSAEKNLP